MVYEEIYIATLNNTELGKGSTHECYVLVPRQVSIESLFNNKIDKKLRFKDDNDRVYDKIRLTIGREKRIVGMSDYYDELDLSAGDKIIFRKKTQLDNTDYFVSSIKYSDKIIFNKYNKSMGFEVQTNLLIKELQDQPFILDILHKGQMKKLKIEFYSSEKKRKDSPTTTDFYNLYLDEVSINEQYERSDLLMLQKINGLYYFSKIDFKWQKYDISYE